MARSKVGGAFGFLRGSIGSVTYSTRKNKAGKKVQIARQKAESVSNPNSTAQILQRMKLGPAQRFFDAFEEVVAKGILSHSFESVPYGSASRQHFISLAMKKADAVYVPKGVDFFVPGEYQVSEGSLPTISYFNQLTAEEAAQNTLLIDFNGEPLTEEMVDAFCEEHVIEQGMQVTLIGARAVANGRYEPFATRILMKEGLASDYDINVQLYDNGVIVVGDETIAAVAIIMSKGSQESNDYRSTQTMKFVNGYDSLKSLDALQAAIASYQEGYEVNSLNSQWYLNQDNGQAFNGRVEMISASFVNGESDWKRNLLAGLQVSGDTLKYVIYTTDGTEDGEIYVVDSHDGSGRRLVPRDGSLGKYIVDPKPVTFAKLTDEIAAQGGFILGEE